MFRWPDRDTLRFEGDTAPPCSPADLPALSPAQHRLLTEPWPGNEGRADGANNADANAAPCPWPLTLDARPLALLVQSAHAGHRVHAFMRLQHPGDLLRGLWVQWTEDTPAAPLDRAPDAPRLNTVLRQRLDFFTRSTFARQPRLRGLAFAHFDALWLPGGLPASHWDRPGEMPPDEAAWQRFRQTPLWPARLQALLDTVQALQAQLRCSRDPLLQHELARIDQGQHWRDQQPRAEQVAGLSALPDTTPRLPAAMHQALLALAARPDVDGVSAMTTDRHTWRQLVQLQLQRAADRGGPPREALWLNGPLDTVSAVLLRDWGGEVAVPLEGLRPADVTLLPALGGYATLDEFFAEQRWYAAQRAGDPQGPTPCRYLLLRQPLPAGPSVRQRAVANWQLAWHRDTPAPDPL
jgi:hypothetical protein